MDHKSSSECALHYSNLNVDKFGSRETVKLLMFRYDGFIDWKASVLASIKRDDNKIIFKDRSILDLNSLKSGTTYTMQGGTAAEELQ